MVLPLILVWVVLCACCTNVARKCMSSAKNWPPFPSVETIPNKLNVYWEVCWCLAGFEPGRKINNFRDFQGLMAKASSSGYENLCFCRNKIFSLPLGLKLLKCGLLGHFSDVQTMVSVEFPLQNAGSRILVLSLASRHCLFLMIAPIPQVTEQGVSVKLVQTKNRMNGLFIP